MSQLRDRLTGGPPALREGARSAVSIVRTRTAAGWLRARNAVAGLLFVAVRIALGAPGRGLALTATVAAAGSRRLPVPVVHAIRRGTSGVSGGCRALYGRLPAGLRWPLDRVAAGVQVCLAPRTERERERRRILGLTIPFFVLAIFAAFVPLAYMVRMSLSADNLRNEGWSTAAWETILSEPTYYRVAFNTLWFAALAAVVSVAVGIGVTHAIEKYDLPFERLLVAVISFPIALPGLVVAFLIVVLLGRQGLVTNALAAVVAPNNIDLASAYTLVGLFLGYVYSLIPRATMVLRGTYAELNTEAEEAARALGASPARTFYHVTLPEIRPGVVAALILTFRTALAIFGTVLILQSLDVATLQIDQELNVGFNSQVAGAIGVVYFLFILAFTFVALRHVETEVVEI
jgi:putative spermidine/putrescine transport system permease protein